LQVKDAITKFYTDKGYTTTGALIPPQTLEAGVIKIQVIEGSLQEIKIVGNRRLHSRYIRDRIQLSPEKPFSAVVRNYRDINERTNRQQVVLNQTHRR